MRIFKPAFLLMALLVGTSFAADGVVASRVIPNSVATGRDSVADENVARTTTSRATANRTTVSRATPGNTNGNRSDGRGGVASRTNTNRSVASRGSDSTTSRTNTNRSTVSRAATTNASRGTAARATATQSRATNVTRASVSGTNAPLSTPRGAITARGGTTTNTGRATITTRGSSAVLGTGGIRMSTATVGTQESVAETRERLDRSSDLHKTCQVQYNECMDQFCAVLDESQKRCSCSSNLSRYSKTEKAVTEATEKLNEVAQSIRYVGLSADEIRAILTETEAEEVMRDTKDNSATRNMLQQIEEMIKDPTSRTNNYVSDVGFGLDLDLSFSSDALDIFNLDFLNLGTNGNSVSNVRGAELYKTAKKRCSTILSQCKDAGATQDQIVGNYDMAIDRDCIAYEADLKQRNETLVSNVRSANLILQKARLAVLQNKNQYDALGCVAALENCMKDDMVCGEDYLQCVDPTKTYIDADGSVIMGQDITVIQSFMSEYNNAVLDKEFLQNTYDNTEIDYRKCRGDGKCVVKYLLQKIGTKQKTTDEGLCRAVLDRCQNYTYDSNRKYKPYNDIVINFLQRAMVNIKSAQQHIISDYASNCITDVSACYTQQVSQIGSLSSYTNRSNVYSIMRGACRSVALTCGLAIFTGKPEIDPNQQLNVGEQTYSVSDCKYIAESSPVPEYGTSTYNNAIINCISDMFYDSLLNNTGSSDSDYYDYDNDGCRTGYAMTDGQCSAITYNISYELGGGSFGASHPESVVYDSSFEVSAPTMDGYVFAGWNIEGMDTTMHKIGGAARYDRSVSGTTAREFRNLISTPGTVSFTAKWRNINELTHVIPDASCTGLIPEVNGGCIASGYRCETGYKSKLLGVCEYITINQGGNSGGGGGNSGGNGENSGGDGGDTPGGGGDGVQCDGGQQSDSGCTSETTGLGGCVKKGCACSATTVPEGGTCVNPCSDVAYTVVSDDCNTESESGCVKQYCKCQSGYHLDGDRCVADTPSGDGKYTLTYSCGNYGGKAPASIRVEKGAEFSFADLIGSGCNISKYAAIAGWRLDGEQKLYRSGSEDWTYTWDWDRNRTAKIVLTAKEDQTCSKTEVVSYNSSSGEYISEAPGKCVANGYKCEDGYYVIKDGEEYFCGVPKGPGCNKYSSVSRYHAWKTIGGSTAGINCMCDTEYYTEFNDDTGGGSCIGPVRCPESLNKTLLWYCTGFQKTGMGKEELRERCVELMCMCKDKYTPQMVNGRAMCVDPCDGINNSTANSECVTGDEPGCIVPGCKCNDGFNPDNGQCVKYVLEYECGNYGGRPPNPQQNISLGDTFSVADIGGCNQPGGYTTGIFLGWQFNDDTDTFYHRPEYRQYTWDWARNRIMEPKYSINSDSGCTGPDDAGTTGGCVASGYRCIPGYTTYQTSGGEWYCAPSCDGGASKTDPDEQTYADQCTGDIYANNMARGCATLFCNCIGENQLTSFDETTGGGQCRTAESCPVNSSTNWQCTWFKMKNGIESAEGPNGCVSVNCGCNDGWFPDKENDVAKCVNPCNGFGNAVGSDDCDTGTESGCVAKWCKCRDGFNPSGGRCVYDSGD